MRFFRNVYYRAAAAPIASATKAGSYPDYTFSGFTRLVGEIGEGAKVGVDPETEARGDGSNAAVGEIIPVEIPIHGFTVANVATIRTAFINQKVDVMLYDPEQPEVAYIAHGIRLYPKQDYTSGATPKITLTGERKTGMLATSLFQPITIS